MEDRDWKIIKVLSSEKNITKAAQMLYMSQPALTSRLRHIEGEFGAQIVNRSTKGIEFTPEGAILAEVAEFFIEQMDHLKDRLRQNSNQYAGTIIIAASNYFTLYTLPGLLQSFAQEYPDVSYKISTDWSKDIFSMVYAQKAHVGFVSVDYGGFSNIHFLYEDPICVTYFKHFELEDLPKLPRITYQSDYLIQSRLSKWWRNNYDAPPFVNMHVDKLVSCKEMVQNGLGYAFLPKRMIQDMPEAYSIPIVDKNNKMITRKTWMIYNDKAAQLPVVQLFIDYVKATKL